MIGYIYLTTNKINGKKYIGRHKATEFEGHKYLGSGVALKRAIKKYGVDNFEIEMLESVNTSYDDLVIKEQEYIARHDAVNDTLYYNNSYGGFEEGFIRGSQNIACTERARKMNSDAHKKPCTQDRRQKMSEYWKTHEHPRGFEGHHHTEEAKRKCSEATRRSNLARGKEFYEKTAAHHIGSKMMNKDGVQKWVYANDIEKFLLDGWVVGACKKRAPRKSKVNQ